VGGRVDAESTGALPREHTVGVGFVEQASPVEVPEHAALDDVLKLVPVLGMSPTASWKQTSPFLV